MDEGEAGELGADLLLEFSGTTKEPGCTIQWECKARGSPNIRG